MPMRAMPAKLKSSLCVQTKNGMCEERAARGPARN